ncbi:hypothetical protein DM860_003361 [Cuscuta australis]|uniref:Uncharacterized protein n=1 Tax=Cuscuta australis TaxID=267555 RepID=A0A328DFG1_9ASTE|nr:hypothetical protein DM860_003361 [Cuscuta australis]
MNVLLPSILKLEEGKKCVSFLISCSREKCHNLSLFGSRAGVEMAIRNHIHQFLLFSQTTVHLLATVRGARKAYVCGLISSEVRHFGKMPSHELPHKLSNGAFGINTVESLAREMRILKKRKEDKKETSYPEKD